MGPSNRCLLATGITSFRDRPLELWIGIYYTVVGVLVAILELTFIITKCKVCREGGSCWRAIIWFDNWKKAVLYILLAIVCFIFPFGVPLGILSGCMLLVAAFLYSIKTCKPTEDEEERQQLSEEYDVLRSAPPQSTTQNGN
ncbi:uncharacterized protein [Ptychodera flava]|uniref:uncharacterized protein isoform X2 n=1 Tax=Ptychodera flava TaxID=63121 RepID=UPI00396A6315